MADRPPEGHKRPEGNVFQSITTDEATIDGHRVYIQSSQPSNPDTDDIWFDLP